MGAFHLKSGHFCEINFIPVGILLFSYETFNIRILTVIIKNILVEISSLDLRYCGTFYDQYLLSNNESTNRHTKPK